MPWALSASTKAFLPPVPKVSVECTIAHFIFFSSLTPYSAITFDEYRSFGRTRKIHGLLTLVRLGSLPPINAGTFDFAIVGEAACTWVLRRGPMTPTTPASISLV